MDDQELKFAASQKTPISDTDRLKIESFYRSFGTSLFVCSSSACLYTVNSAKKSQACSTTNTLQKVANRNSMQSMRQLNNINNQQHTLPQSYEVDQDLIKNIINNEQKLPDNISVSHCGIPLWLFNTGINSRRPNRQLKFTLSEKGTGFILWQDRIDLNSHLKMYTIKKEENSNLICIENFNQFLLNNEENDAKINQTHLPILITFRASDKKTSVFIRFDINNEAISFYNYYLDLLKKNADMMCSTQRAKSLPAGLTSSSVYSTVNRYHKSNTFKIDTNKSKLNNKYTGSKTGTIFSTRNNDNLNINNINNNNNTINNRKMKRQSCFITFSSTNKIKKITKNDISNPSNVKHITNIKPNDRSVFYTLSKLLPSFFQTNNKSTNEITTVKNDKISSNNKLTPSPTYSILTSSSSSGTSSHLLSDSSNVILNEENSFNQNNNLIESNIDNSLSFSSFIKSKSSSVSSTSSASSISPPFIKIKNRIDENENIKSNSIKSNCFAHQLNEMRNFEAKKKSLFSKQKTLK
jgi:hypothetical protein